MSSLPTELDFQKDRSASPARMNLAMEYILRRIAGLEAIQPEFERVIEQIRAIGLSRVTDVLAPILADAERIAEELAALRAQLEQDGIATIVIDAVLDVVFTRTAADARFSPLGHGHSIDDIAGLAAALAGKLSEARLGTAGGIATLGPGGRLAGDQTPIEMLDLPQVIRNGNAVLELSDRGKHIYRTDPTINQTIRIPSYAEVEFGIGTHIRIVLSDTAAAVDLVLQDTLLAGGFARESIRVQPATSVGLLKIEPAKWILLP